MDEEQKTFCSEVKRAKHSEIPDEKYLKKKQDFFLGSYDL